jgi:glycosyltransferase involved in cell wall biosynthesis
VRVLVVNNMAPFISGGAESMAEHLRRNIERAGHPAEVLRIPFQWDPATRIPSQMLMARALELHNVDHVVALKFPAYLIPHPRKTLWLVHQYRQAYDLYDAGQTNLPSDATGAEIRALIRNADDECFRGARRIYAISDVTQQRLAKYNGFASLVLRAPLNDPELFEGGAPQGYIFAGGRVNAHKRQHLMLEAMAFAPRAARLVVAGPPDTAADAARLHEAVERLGLQARVRLDLRFLERREYAAYVNGASAVASLPFDEESFSYVAMEAAAAAKGLISTTDSGGVLGLAVHGETAWVAAPEAKALAQAMGEVHARPKRAMAYGAAARARWTACNINWPATVEALLS